MLIGKAAGGFHSEYTIMDETGVCRFDSYHCLSKRIIEMKTRFDVKVGEVFDCTWFDGTTQRFTKLLNGLWLHMDTLGVHRNEGMPDGDITIIGTLSAKGFLLL